MEPVFPTVQEAQELHDEAQLQHGQTPEPLLDSGKLESAMGRAANHYYYGQGTEQERLADAAGALAHGIGMAQAFGDGNKRAAYYTTHYFLHNNGYGHAAPAEDEELADHLVGHGEGTHSLEDTQAMFRARMAPRVASVVASILDPIHSTLPEAIWNDLSSPEPQLKPRLGHWIRSFVYGVLERHGYTSPHKWLHLCLTGSLTSFQYSDQSDADISLFVDAAVFPEWSRSEMIGLMISNTDGHVLPGTPYPLQCFVVGKGLKPTDLYKPGLRSGYSIDENRWIVPPEHREHDVKATENGAYVWALEGADKMDRLLRYEPDKAVEYWHQIHQRRMRDQKMGKGDFSDSNILYKFLNQRDLFPRIAEVSGEHIAAEPPRFTVLPGGRTEQPINDQPSIPIIDQPSVGDLVPPSSSGWHAEDWRAYPCPECQDTEFEPTEWEDQEGSLNAGWHCHSCGHYQPDDRFRPDWHKRPPNHLRLAAWEDHFVNQINPIADAYDRLPTYDPAAVGAWQELAQDSAQRAAQIRNRLNVTETDNPEPYANAHEMFNDINKGNFQVSRANSDHPIWTPSQNVDFRIVHDVLGHHPSGGDFGWQGENLACGRHFGMVSPNAQRALMTECLGQTGSAIRNGGFGPQRVGLMDPLLLPAQQAYNRTASMPEGGFCHRHIRHGIYRLPDKL